MAYRVVYGSLGEEKRTSRAGKKRKTFLALAMVLGMLVLATLFHAGVLPWVQDVLLPGDSAVTAAALENMVSAILGGTGFAEAIEAFCREIIVHGSA